MAMPPMDGEAASEFDYNDASATRGGVTELFGRKVREGGVDGTTRFDALSRVIGYWIRRCREGHVTPTQAWDEIVAYNAARIDPPWTEQRLRAEAEKLWKLDCKRNGEMRSRPIPQTNRDPTGPTAATTVPVPPRFSEDALASAFIEQHAERWRYVAAWGQWLHWTGSLWRREETLQAFDLSRHVCRRAAAARCGNTKLKRKISSAATIAAVERIARADRYHAATTDIWDRDPWLLNTPGGVVDLRSGLSVAHDPVLAMTKIARPPRRATARCGRSSWQP